MSRASGFFMRRFKISETAATMCIVIIGLFLALLALGLLASVLVYPFERPLPYGVGLLIGSSLSALKVILLEKALEKSVDMDGKGAKGYANLQAIARYALTIVVLLGAVFFPGIVGVFGVIIGVLTLQIAAYITNRIINARTPSK